MLLQGFGGQFVSRSKKVKGSGFYNKWNPESSRMGIVAQTKKSQTTPIVMKSSNFDGKELY